MSKSQLSYQDLLSSIPNLSYDKLRLQVKNGDLIFFSGRGFSNFFLKSFGKLSGGYPLSHVAVVRSEYSRLEMLEATMPTSRCVMVSNFLEHFKGDVIFTNVITGLSLEEDNLRTNVIINAIDLLGKPYERIHDLVGSFVVSKFRSIEGDNRIFCSEYASLVWHKAGIDLLNEIDLLHPSPSVLFNSYRIKPIGYFTL